MNDRPGVIAPPPLIYAAFFALGCWLARLLMPVEFPHVIRMAGVLVIAAGLLLGGFGFFTMRRAGTNVDPYRPAVALVTRGPFGRSRNPLYLSLTTVYIGAALLFNVAPAIVLAPVLMLVMHFGVVRREERYLEAKFGDAYRVYRSNVRRWI